MKRTAEVIAVGSELLLGGRVETNSIFLSDRLAALGIPVRFKTVVSDEAPDIAGAIRTAASRTDIVLVTGGLGPTCDDCTRQAVAKVTGRRLRRHQAALEGVRRQLAIWGRVPSRAQLQQALIPRGATVLANPVGSAPGFSLLWRGTFLAVLPGVPSEAKAMFDQALMPQLLQRSGTNPGRIDRHVIHTFGLPEAEVDQQVSAVLSKTRNVRLGLLASPLGVSIILTVTTLGDAAGDRGGDLALEQAARRVRQRLGRWIFAEGEGTLEEVVGRQLALRRLCLAVAESCTGGLIGHRLTEVPGSSAYVDRVLVSYSNRAKEELLGVAPRLIQRYGAVSAQVAAAMAQGVRRRSRTDVGLSVTGIAGPDGGSETKPVGLVYIGLNATGEANGRTTMRRGRGYQEVREYRFHGSRQAIKLRASQAALDLLRQWLMGPAKPERRRPRKALRR